MGEKIEDKSTNLFSGDPVEGHLRAHVVVEGAVRVVGHHLLSGTLAFPHGFERAVPVQQLEDGHQLLEFQHGPPFIGLQHEAEGTDARIGIVRFVRIALQSRVHTHTHTKDGRQHQFLFVCFVFLLKKKQEEEENQRTKLARTRR